MNLLKSLFYFCLGLVYPHTCIICNQFMKNQTKSFCTDCKENFNPIVKSNRLNKLLNADGLDTAYSGWYFSNGLDDLIHSLKYNDRAKLGLELGRHLGQLISPDIFGQVDILTAVPLHRVKLRDRGYNQAEWIGKGVAEIWNIPFKKQIIKRNRFTVSQTTLNKKERITNMANAFSIIRNVSNLSIVIFDDVLTTGSTMSACALSLKQAGAASVNALTVSTPMDK